METLDYDEFIAEKSSALISLIDNGIKYKGMNKLLYYSSTENYLKINGQIYSPCVPSDVFLGIIETTVLNVKHLLNSAFISASTGYNHRFNPLNCRVYEVSFELILQKGKLRLFYYNATTYGMHVLVENDTIVYLCDGFNQREIVLKGKNIHVYRAFLMRCNGCFGNKISEDKLVLNACSELRCLAFCFWGSGYIDAYGNSGLYMPNLAVKLHSILPNYITQVSWKTSSNNIKDWFEQNLSIYKNRILEYLSNIKAKKIFIGHSQGCLFALALSKIVPVDALILLTPQTMETYDFFLSQAKINDSQKEVEQVFKELFRSICRKDEFEEKEYVKVFGNEYFRIKSLLSLEIGKLYREIDYPCLMLYGENDIQVNIDNYYEGKKLEDYNRNIRAKIIPRMHHFLAESTFGSWGDYSDWKPLSPAARLQIKDFLQNEVQL